MDDELCWTYLSGVELARKMTDHGGPVCADTARSMLQEAGLGKRKIKKSKAMGQVENRNEQFEKIAQLRAKFEREGLPVISIDSKKKEFLGDLFRPGAYYGNGPQIAFDHDFPSFATGKLVPHGVYDTLRNVGHLTLGTSADTSQFATDSLYLW